MCYDFVSYCMKLPLLVSFHPTILDGAVHKDKDSINLCLCIHAGIFIHRVTNNMTRQQIKWKNNQRRTQGIGVKPPLSLICYKNFITRQNRLYMFTYIFCLFIDNLTHIGLTPGSNFPCNLWVTLNRLRTGVGRFSSDMCQWGLTETASCICAEESQPAHHIIYHCEALRPPNSLDDLVSTGPEGIRRLGRLVGITWGTLLMRRKNLAQIPQNEFAWQFQGTL